MPEVHNIGRALLIAGILIAAVVLLLLYWDRFPWLSQTGLFRRPGDIVFEKKFFRFYFPVTTCIIVSVLLSLILWFLGRK